MKHERKKQTIRDTNKMGKYKLRVTKQRGQRGHREQSSAGREGEAD